MDRVLVFALAALFTVTVTLAFLGAAYVIIIKLFKFNIFSVKIQTRGVYFIISRRNKAASNLINLKIAEKEYALAKDEEDKLLDGILTAKRELNAKVAGN